MFLPGMKHAAALDQAAQEAGTRWRWEKWGAGRKPLQTWRGARGSPLSDGWEPGVAAAWGPRSCPALGEPAASLIWLDGPILVLTDRC